MRKFKPMKLPEFKKLIKNTFGDNFDVAKMTVKEDLNIQFDFENLEYTTNPKTLIGYHRLKNGLCFLGILAGGDWEFPVFYINYYNGDKFRSYVPKKGNLYNKETKTAFGNETTEEEEMDIQMIDWKHIRKGLLEHFYEQIL